MRFVDLMEDTRDKIRNWISQEPLRPVPPDARDAVRNALAGSQPSTSGALPEGDQVLKSIFADPGLFLVGSKSTRSKPAVQQVPIVAEEPPQAPSAAPLPERRSHPRRRVLSLEYLDLGDSNGGIILNLGEDGMYIQAVASLSPERVSNLSFKIPEFRLRGRDQRKHRVGWRIKKRCRHPIRKLARRSSPENSGMGRS